MDAPSTKTVLTSQRDQVIERLVEEKIDFKFKDKLWVSERKRAAGIQSSVVMKAEDRREFSFIKAGKYSKNVK